ncbi:MAG: DUF4434 domain-containing protein [Clostridia bacterium]|nr:DUF4434 domain-containing protein [Clostridia bacterium]
MGFPITATFIDEITYDIPSSNWSFEQWSRDLDNMQSVGIDTLVFIRAGYGERTVFPSDYFGTHYEEDLLGFILDEATKRNMKVMVGGYLSNINWNNGDAKTEIELNRHFINEIWAKYGDRPAFGGWYIPQETSLDVLNITEVMKGISYICKEKSAELPVLISPFFNTLDQNSKFTVEQHVEEWNNIFIKCGENIDICAFQDGTVPIKDMRDYYVATKKLCGEHNISHWVNTETFERDVRQMYYPIPFTILKRKLELHKEYAEKILTFEFSHFLSPQSIYPSAKNLYNLYTEYYK